MIFWSDDCPSTVGSQGPFARLGRDGRSFCLGDGRHGGPGRGIFCRHVRSGWVVIDARRCISVC